MSIYNISFDPAVTCESPSVSKDKFLCFGMFIGSTTSRFRNSIFWELVEGFRRVDLGVGTGLRFILWGDPGVPVSLSVSDMLCHKLSHRMRNKYLLRSSLYLHSLTQ